MTRPFLSRSLLKDRITFLVSFQSHWTGSDEQIGGTPWSCAVAQTDSACAKRLRQRSQTSISGRARSELFQIVVFVLPRGVIERIEDNVVRGPVLDRLHTQVVVVQRAI